MIYFPCLKKPGKLCMCPALAIKVDKSLAEEQKMNTLCKSTRVVCNR